MADKLTDVQKAESQAAKDRIAAEDAARKVADAGKSPERKRADEAGQKADDSRAEAAELKAEAEHRTEPMTVEEARVGVSNILDPDMGAGDHMAQKFGNDPENPKPARGEHADPALCTVRLTRITPDLPEPAVTMVHPDMVGDYLRAGWSR